MATLNHTNDREKQIIATVTAAYSFSGLGWGIRSKLVSKGTTTRIGKVELQTFQGRCSRISCHEMSNPGLAIADIAVWWNPKKKVTARTVTSLYCMAGRPGFEPGLTESESAVLPLDDLPEKCAYPIQKSLVGVNRKWNRFHVSAQPLIQECDGFGWRETRCWCYHGFPRNFTEMKRTSWVVACCFRGRFCTLPWSRIMEGSIWDASC